MMMIMKAKQKKPTQSMKAEEAEPCRPKFGVAVTQFQWETNFPFDWLIETTGIGPAVLSELNTFTVSHSENFL